jgi:capping protein alpha
VAGCVAFIMEAEKEFQTSLGTFFIQDAVDVFKNLRRALPITKSKIEWPAILSYKVGEELQKQ